jgi:hypothetical protein
MAVIETVSLLDVATKTSQLIFCLQKNIATQCELDESATISPYYFPSNDYITTIEIGFVLAGNP